MFFNVLKNGNCIDLMKDIEDSCIDLIITDPPYKINPYGTSTCGGFFKKDIVKKGFVFENNDILFTEFAPEFFRILKNGSHCYVMCNNFNLINMLNAFVDVGFHFIKSLIWNKGNKIMGQFYMSQYEYILFFRKGFGKKINNCSTPDILDVLNKKNKDFNGFNFHDCEKPIELIEILVLNSSNKNDVVLDPFMGLGSTCLASLKNDRRFIGFEINKKYFDIALNRLNSFKKNGLEYLDMQRNFYDICLFDL